MTKIIQNVEFLNNPARFSEPYRFRVLFECMAPLPDGTYSLSISFETYSHKGSPLNRPRMAPHIRLFTGKRRTWSRARFMSRRTRARRGQRLRVRIPCTRSKSYTQRRRAWRRGAHPHGVVQRSGVCPCGLLPEHGVRERGTKRESTVGYPLRLADEGYQHEA